MKVPKIFIPEKNQDEKLENLLQDKKPDDNKPIKGIKSLDCLPKNIGIYALNGEFMKITKKRWDYFFGEQIPDYILQAAWMTYQAPFAYVFTSIYFLEFKSKECLDELSKKMNLEKEINQVNATRTRCLKKDNCLIAIKSNHTDTNSLNVIGDWYVNNLGLEDL